MSFLSSIFPEQQFSSAELFEIAEAFTRPAVKKYLKQELANSIKALAEGRPKEGESAESYLRREAEVQGGLVVLETLLQIEKPSVSAS